MGRKRVDPDKRKHLTPAERIAQIKTAAFDIAAADGLATVSIAEVARRLSVTGPLVIRYMERLEGLRLAVIGDAVTAGNADIIADAIEMELPLTDVPAELMTKARAVLQAAATA